MSGTGTSQPHVPNYNSLIVVSPSWFLAKPLTTLANDEKLNCRRFDAK